MPAARARKIARDTLAFFDEVIAEHHAEEERALFPAVRASATAGAERDNMVAIADRLTTEHRQIESQWTRVKPLFKQIAKGQVQGETCICKCVAPLVPLRTQSAVTPRRRISASQ